MVPNYLTMMDIMPSTNELINRQVLAEQVRQQQLKEQEAVDYRNRYLQQLQQGQPIVTPGASYEAIESVVNADVAARQKALQSQLQTQPTALSPFSHKYALNTELANEQRRVAQEELETYRKQQMAEAMYGMQPNIQKRPALAPPTTIGAAQADIAIEEATDKRNAARAKYAEQMFNQYLKSVEAIAAKGGDADKSIQSMADKFKKEGEATDNPYFLQLADYAESLKGTVAPTKIAKQAKAAIESGWVTKKGEKPVLYNAEAPVGEQFSDMQGNTLTEDQVKLKPTAKERGAVVGTAGKLGTGRQINVVNLETGESGTAYQSELNPRANEYDKNLVSSADYQKYAPKAALGYEIRQRIKDVKSSMPVDISPARMALINKRIDPHSFAVTRVGIDGVLSDKELSFARKLALLKESILGSKTITVGSVGVGKDVRDAIVSTIPGQLNMGAFNSKKQLDEADTAIRQALSYVPKKISNYIEREAAGVAKTIEEEAVAKTKSKYSVGGIYKEPGTNTMKILGLARDKDSGEVTKLLLENGIIKNLVTGAWERK